MSSSPLRPPTETEIQAAILDLLQRLQILAWRNQSIPVPIRKGKQIVGLRKANGFNVGIPDILCVIKGRLVGLEVKKPGKNPEPEQIVWQERIIKAGGLCTTVRSVDDVLSFLQNKNLI